jgi:hypothetical protein
MFRGEEPLRKDPQLLGTRTRLSRQWRAFTGYNCSSRKSETSAELSRQKQDGWGMRPASSSVGRRRIPFARREQTSRVSSAASEDASPLEEPNDTFVVKQKTAST